MLLLPRMLWKQIRGIYIIQTGMEIFLHHVDEVLHFFLLDLKSKQSQNVAQTRMLLVQESCGNK